MKRKITKLKNGLRQVTVYRDDNTIKGIYTIDKQGKRQGEAIEYNTEDGYNEKRCFYKDDLLEDPSEGYVGDTLLFRCNYTAGKKNGVEERFWDKYHIMSRRTFVNGLEEGGYEEYHDNGRLRETGSFKQGKLNGQVRRYSRDGKLIKITGYKDGKKDGLCLEWNAYGELIKDCVYQNDEVVLDNLEKDKLFRERSEMAAQNKKRSRTLKSKSTKGLINMAEKIAKLDEASAEERKTYEMAVKKALKAGKKRSEINVQNLRDNEGKARGRRLFKMLKDRQKQQ